MKHLTDICFRVALNVSLSVMAMCIALSSNAAISSRVEHSAPNYQPAGFFIAPKQTSASSAGEAAKIAKSLYGGKVLKVSTQKTEEGIVYRVKLLLENGHVKVVVIAAQ